MREVGLRLAAEAFRYACGDMSITLGLGVGLAAEYQARNDENGDDGNP
jgi:hypothetical protein